MRSPDDARSKSLKWDQSGKLAQFYVGPIPYTVALLVALVSGIASLILILAVGPLLCRGDEILEAA